MRRLVYGLFLLCCAFTAHGETRVIVLGSGTPVPHPERAGPGVAVVVDGAAYLFDAGGGVAQRAIEASQRHDIPGLIPQEINHLFITHLHSDHLHDVAEIASARWWSRPQRLQVFGPRGTRAYMDLVDSAAAIEADIRAVGTPPELIVDREGFRTVVTEIEDGLVYEDVAIRVEAFTVPHGDIRPAFGFKVITADKTIVISGDTTYSEEVARQAAGADILLHEVVSGDRLGMQSEFWQDYHGSSHTTGTQVAQVANAAQPGLVVLYHILFLGATAEEVVAEVKRDYDGEVVLANDLDAF